MISTVPIQCPTENGTPTYYLQRYILSAINVRPPIFSCMPTVFINVKDGGHAGIELYIYIY